VLRFLWIDVVETLLRMLPWPCETGLVELGQPGRNSPVLLTGNFRLTVERVTRSLAGVDAWLLVANSRGVNVWCAATGGLLTNHDVVSVLKTSGIAERVDHRNVILPQLAATGIEGVTVHKKTGWKVAWGPLRADAIPAFLAGDRQVTREQRTAAFPWPERIEMAIAWAFPISVVAMMLALAFWRQAAPGILALVWGAALLIFSIFPLVDGWLRGVRARGGTRAFDLAQRGLPIALWLLASVGLAALLLASGDFSWGLLLRWDLVCLAVILILTLDLMGSTPVYKSGLHEDRLFRIRLDEARCKGAGFCEQVCPKDVFEVDRAARMALLPRADACVQCGACIVQCPFDALHFETPSGAAVTPATVRRFKLNLMGHRTVSAGETDASVADPKAPPA